MDRWIMEGGWGEEWKGEESERWVYGLDGSLRQEVGSSIQTETPTNMGVKTVTAH